MRLVDLTLPVPPRENDHPTARLEEWPIPFAGGTYTAMIHHFSHWSMSGTYIDFPSHIKETDDGQDAANYPAEKLFRVQCRVIHLNRADGSGRIGADELRAACPAGLGGIGGAMVINALGPLRFDQIKNRSVFLGKDAVDWIIETGVHLLVSDVYESDVQAQGVFQDLFARGISTVCCPVNLHQLTSPQVRITALPLRQEGVTQLPCRLLAEVPDANS